MQPNRHRTPSKPLDREALGRLALHYVGRYATTRAKLADYLRRKVQERGWDGQEPADVDAVVARCSDLGYVDDSAFAAMRAGALGRRGYGPRRIGAALHAAGIDRDVAATAIPDAAASAAAAAAYAKRKKIGPFGDGLADPALRRKQFAAMLRAGHSFELARHYADAGPTSSHSDNE